MNAIVDPLSGLAMCGACGALHTTVEYAAECCEVEAAQPAWRAILAGAIVFSAVVFTILLGTC